MAKRKRHKNKGLSAEQMISHIFPGKVVPKPSRSKNPYGFQQNRTSFTRATLPTNPTQRQQDVISEFLIGKFYMLPEVMLKFAEYARAAQPNEIGGYCRVVKDGNNFIAIDLKVFPQTATAGSFEMDGMERNKWINQMRREGRIEEVAEWNCLIHSHPPGCAPFLSSVDEPQIKELGHRRHAWSIICTANENIAALDWRVHFYHGGDFPFLVKDIPVDQIHPDWKEIHAEVKELQNAGVIQTPDREAKTQDPSKFSNIGSLMDSRVWSGEDDGMLLAKHLLDDLDSEEEDEGLDPMDLISEGSIVEVAVDGTNIGSFDEEVQAVVAGMVDEQYEVEGVEGDHVIVNGIQFDMDDLLLIEP